MLRSARLALGAMALALLAGAAAHGQTQSPADDAGVSPIFSDAALDRLLQQDRNGVVGSGEAMRLLAEIVPDDYAEMRVLLRRFAVAKPDEKVAVTSELLELNTRMMDRVALETRRAPLDALDATIAAVRAALPGIEAADPNLCGFYAGLTDQSDSLTLRKSRPDIVVKVDIASYRAVAAARAHPASYALYDDAMEKKLREAMKAAGVTDDRMEFYFSTEPKGKLTGPERCDLERRYFDALASLPDDVRGPILAFHFSGDDGAGH